ncbi:MAG: C40 family peptidase [Gemmatimonadaceae bacterium]
MAIAPLLVAPAVSSAQVSQLLRGHSADAIASDDAWFRLRGADGYEGWCHRGYLTAEPAFQGIQARETGVGDADAGAISAAAGSATLTPVASAWNSERRMSLGCVVRARGGEEFPLPLGALLDVDDTVTLGIAMNSRARARYFEADADLLVRRAVELFRGAPYQWGGLTPWGADCSGFVQTIFALHGTQLPRDAWMQGERGRSIPNELSELEPGDLLFFSDRDDGRPTHVALSLGGPSVAHCSLANGGFGIDALDSDNAVSRRLCDTFRFARRLF